jgi:hypothetical protein
MMERQLSLQVPPVMLMAYLGSVILASFTLSSGRTTWLTGAVFILAYAVVSAGFFTAPVETFTAVRLFSDLLLNSTILNATGISLPSSLHGQLEKMGPASMIPGFEVVNYYGDSPLQNSEGGTGQPGMLPLFAL